MAGIFRTHYLFYFKRTVCFGFIQNYLSLKNKTIKTKAISTKYNPMKIKVKNTFSSTILLLSVLLFVQNAYCQEQDTLKKVRKNTILINLTSPMIFGDNNYVLGYERTVGKHQSFSVHLGTFALGQLININTDSIKDLNNDVKSRGISFSCDYRFYLAKENKYNSPHGVYIGPYFAFNNFNRTFNIEANKPSGSVQLDADFNFRVTTLGFQLGYQFIFWDRVSLDMILLGPGVSAYKAKVELSTNLTPAQESEFFTKLNEKLQEKIPGYSLVIKPGSFEKSGSVNTTSIGYRYIVMLGFRF